MRHRNENIAKMLKKKKNKILPNNEKDEIGDNGGTKYGLKCFYDFRYIIQFVSEETLPAMKKDANMEAKPSSLENDRIGKKYDKKFDNSDKRKCNDNNQ